MSKTFYLFLIYSLLISCGNTQANSENTDDDRGYIVKVGDMAPQFSLKMFNDSTISLKSLRGKVIMLQFTASWCGVCRKEMPFIEKEIWQKLKNNDNFVLIAIDREESDDKIQELIDATKVTYPFARDTVATVFKLFAHEKAGITRNVIIDKEGRIIYLTRLFDREEFNKMKEVIFSSLEE